MVKVTCPRALAGIAAAVSVSAAHAALVIPADVPALAVPVPVPLDTVGLARGGSDDVNLIRKIVGILHVFIPRAQTALVIGDHIFHRRGTGLFIGTDKVDELGFSTEIALRVPCPAVDVIGLSTAMVQVEHGHKAHAVRVVDDVTIMGAHPRAVVASTPCLALGNEHTLVRANRRAALRQPQQVDIGGDVVLLVQQLGPGGDGEIPLVVLTPPCTIHRRHRHVGLTLNRTETVPEEALQRYATIAGRPSLRHHA